MQLFGKERSFPMTVYFLLGSFVFLYFSLFYLPATPIHFGGGDAPNYMFNAWRMLRGKMIYRDFFEFTPPGTEVFYFLVFKIFGVHSWIPNVVLTGLGLSIAWLIIVISKAVIPGKAAYLPAALFLVIAFRSHLDATHHWFSTLAATGAIALLVESISARRLAGAGALCGLALCFTQSTGLPATLALAIFLLWLAVTHRLSWRNFRRAQLLLWSSFAIAVVLFNAYFVYEGGLKTFLYDTIVFGIRYWPSQVWNTPAIYMTDMPSYLPWYRLPAAVIWLFIYLLIPLIYILFFVRYWQQKTARPSEPWDRLALIAIAGLMLFLGVAAAPSWWRLCFASPAGFILFIWFFSTPGRFLHLRTTAAWAIIVLLAFGEAGERGLSWHKKIKLPIGNVAVLNRLQDKEITFLLDHTKPGDYFFGDEELNYLLALRDPSPISFVTPSDYTRPAQVQETIRGLERYPVKYVYWSSILDTPSVVPHTSSHLAPLRAFLHSHFRLVKTIYFKGFRCSFWEKRAKPSAAAKEQDRSCPQARSSISLLNHSSSMESFAGFAGTGTPMAISLSAGRPSASAARPSVPQRDDNPRSGRGDWPFPG